MGRVTIVVWVSLLVSLPSCKRGGGGVELLNVSYDPTRELYSDINAAFIKDWTAKTGEVAVIKQSHGGSGKQARSIIDGLQADVATLALAYDIDALAQKDLVAKEWQTRLPDKSSPYTSTIVFVVRKGNPKGIRDWDDLAKPGVVVITPNPKTSGGARWNFLAAWSYGLKHFGGDESKVKELVGRIYQNVPVLDSGARGSTITFVQRAIGDVLIAWESEALLSLQHGGEGLQIVTPPMSILAEPPVTVVDKNVDRHGTRALAEAYLRFLYSTEGQTIIAKHYYRPRDQGVAAQFTSRFPTLSLATVDELGGWQKVQALHFSDGGTFDQIYQRKP